MWAALVLTINHHNNNNNTFVVGEDPPLDCLLYVDHLRNRNVVYSEM